MIYKSYPIIVETSINCFYHSKMTTAVASHLFLPELISEMPPGSAKDILYGQTDRFQQLDVSEVYKWHC